MPVQSSSLGISSVWLCLTMCWHNRVILCCYRHEKRHIFLYAFQSIRLWLCSAQRRRDHRPEKREEGRERWAQNGRVIDGYYYMIFLLYLFCCLNASNRIRNLLIADTRCRGNDSFFGSLRACFYAMLTTKHWYSSLWPPLSQRLCPTLSHYWSLIWCAMFGVCLLLAITFALVFYSLLALSLSTTELFYRPFGVWTQIKHSLLVWQ